MSGLPQNPIFIVGYPRSGTTLLQRLLAGLPGDGDGLLHYWLGAWAIQALGGWLPLELAARVPFIALLLLTYVPDISLAIPKLLGGYVSPITNPLGPVFIH